MERPEGRQDPERLHFAVQDGDLDEVRRLIASGAPLDHFDEISRTPLHYAVDLERLDIAATLLDAGADVNARDEERIGNTALGEVAGKCSPGVADFLVTHGADPTIEGWMRLTALDRATRRTRPEGRRVLAILRAATI